MNNRIPPKQNINKSPWSFYQQPHEQDRNLNIKTIKDSTVLYLYNYNTGEEIELDVVPEAVSATYTSRIVKQAPFGVMHPINFYTGGTAKSISFNMDLHEDLDGLQVDANTRSIYALIDRLKSMSEPKSLDGRLMEPLVYLQLGHQFAGKGHIKTGVTFNTPIRRGRYVYINLTVDFTYHEDFQISNIDIDGDVYSATHSGILPEVFNVDEDNYDDFLKETFDYEYVITQVFADAKVSNYLNTLKGNTFYQNATSAAMSNNLSAYLESTLRWEDYGNYPAVYDVVIGEWGLLTLIVELGTIIKPLNDVNTTLANLKILQRKVASLRSKVISMTKMPGGEYADLTGLVPVTISSGDRDLLLGALLSLADVVSNQVAAYSALRGATP